MISVTEAKALIRKHVRASTITQMPTEECVGLTLAEDVFSINNFPPFLQSSMDGYAFRFNDFEENKTLSINGEMQAGSTDQKQIGKGEASRIFTGAPLPEGADTVVMQEKVSILGNQLKIEDEKLALGVNTRAVGSDIPKDALACATGTTLSPATIGFLAGLGNKTLPVFSRPRTSIIVTGKELQDPGNDLSFGQVYESNSYALRAVLHQLGLSDVHVFWVDDEPDLLTNTLSEALDASDLVLLAGGISVGDYDFVLQATQRNFVQQVFHKVKQRPGKPLFFGMKEHKPVFGLPGNPSSVLTCFYEYVIPALEQMLHKKNVVRTAEVTISNAYTKTSALTHFLKAVSDGKKVDLLEGQESYRMRSYSQANCLVVVDEAIAALAAGDKVEIHWTNYFGTD